MIGLDAFAVGGGAFNIFNPVCAQPRHRSPFFWGALCSSFYLSIYLSFFYLSFLLGNLPSLWHFIVPSMSTLVSPHPLLSLPQLLSSLPSYIAFSPPSQSRQIAPVFLAMKAITSLCSSITFDVGFPAP